MVKKGEVVKKVAKKAATVLLGVLAGAANILFGGGGGMLSVPALQYGAEVDEKRAHASAIEVMLPLSVASAVAYTVRGVWDVTLGLTVSAGAVVGGAVGALLLKKVPKGGLSLIFYAVMVYAGIRFLV